MNREDLEWFKLPGTIILRRGGYDDDMFPRSLIRVDNGRLAVAIGKNIYLIRTEAIQ